MVTPFKLNLLFIVGSLILAFWADGVVGMLQDDPEHWDVCTTVQNLQGDLFWCENHVVTTADGYELTIQRIGQQPSRAYGRPVIMLQHGLLDSGYSWILNGANESLSYLAAARGYEVWLGESRGRSVYGMANTHLSPTEDAFWAWTWNDIAANDLPATIDYILAATGASQLDYVGHSQGTMIGFAAFEDPALAAKVRAFVALAPVAYLGNLATPLLRDMAKLPELVLYAALGQKQILGLGDPVPPIFCDLDPSLCDDVICLLAGCAGPNSLNNSVLPRLMSHYPAGTSVMNLMMYAQAVKSGKFQKYDYGTTGNMEHYGTPQPPQYDLGKLATRNTFIYYGTFDQLADPADVKILLSQIPTPSAVTEVPLGHGGFTWSLLAPSLVYLPLLDQLASL